MKLVNEAEGNETYSKNQMRVLTIALFGLGRAGKIRINDLFCFLARERLVVLF